MYFCYLRILTLFLDIKVVIDDKLYIFSFSRKIIVNIWVHILISSRKINSINNQEITFLLSLLLAQAIINGWVLFFSLSNCEAENNLDNEFFYIKILSRQVRCGFAHLWFRKIVRWFFIKKKFRKHKYYIKGKVMQDLNSSGWYMYLADKLGNTNL